MSQFWRYVALGGLGTAAFRFYEMGEYRLVIAVVLLTAAFIHGVPRRVDDPSPDTGAHHG